jgi:pyrroline-5-carboxylate reductase
MNAAIMLVGCGNMGGAMAAGWVAQGRASSLTIIEPMPERPPANVRHLAAPPSNEAPPAVLVLAIKPQMLAAVAPTLRHLVGPGTILLSILAAVEIETLHAYFPTTNAIVRAVPNLPAAIGAGVTALAATGLDAPGQALVTALCQPLGDVVWLDNEAQIDAATSVSGCGPAFLFRYADAVIRAGVAQGLTPAQARQLLAATMVGAGRMLQASDTGAAEMAQRVASPGGVTLAGLAVLDRDAALVRLMAATLGAAAARSAEMAIETQPKP